MKVHLFTLLLFLAALLSACGSGRDTVNPRLTPTAIAAIQKGTTTREQVRALLGAPQSAKTQAPIPHPPGTPPLPAKYAASEVWAFWSARTESSWFRLPFIAPKAKQSGYTVIIFFDPQGAVLDCQVEEKHT